MKLEMIRSIVEKDNELNKMNIQDQDLLVAFQYIMQRDQNDLKDFYPKLVLKPYAHIAYIPTKEKVMYDSTRKLRSYLEIFESDIYISDATLDDFIIEDDIHEKAIKYAKSLIHKKDTFYKGLFLVGPYGSGKSYLLSGLANDLTKSGVDVVYVFVPDLIRSIKTSIGSDMLEKKINILKRADCLILDDLGGENLSVWFRDEVLLPILHYRLNAKLPVHISSNLFYTKLADALKTEKEDSVKVMRIIKRIQDLTEPFVFTKVFKKD
ncbi:Primosomal protein DnaI [Acholeplasma oculi]|uniref:Prisomal protein DnaI n=1 Tax=Acholeplasma oculi TaxID=35623 RepID=A0A061ACM1_9MOLU|nr:ATP-binding protein [Acholeplasma oculi]CDR31159.1 Prisomal protein DnaI [Acholeplasma oculi]SKC37589.1 replicative DNA helicase loader DnaI [Acholeplasma oculi]SUT90988.1 Primosomal protein DnaI [Acholeplasma oculi]